MQRMVSVVKWYLSGWHVRPKVSQKEKRNVGIQLSPTRKIQGCKKPYNPLLGEEFVAFWDHGDSKSFMLAEQVSHHPPVSAIYIENRKKNISINAHIWTKSKFLGGNLASDP